MFHVVISESAGGLEAPLQIKASFVFLDQNIAVIWKFIIESLSFLGVIDREALVKVD